MSSGSDTMAGSQDASPVTPPSARWVIGGAIASLFAAVGVLWWTQGTKVFFDTLAAGFAWCF